MLAPDYARAKNYNVTLALNGPQGAFLNTALAFDEWLEKLWELEGDGCIPATPTQSRMIAEMVVHDRELAHLARTPGLGKALCECAQRGFGVPEFEQALQEMRAGDPEGSLRARFTAAECEMLSCVGEYAERLREAGLVDKGLMLDYLSDRSDEVFPTPVQVLVLGDEPLSAQQQAFFDRCAALLPTHAVEVEPSPLSRAPIGDVRAALPSGPYAQPQVALDAIDDARRDGCGSRIVVTCRHPLDLFERIAPALAQAGISCSVSDRKPFAQTDLGHAYMRAVELAEGEGVSWDSAALSDALHSSAVWAPKRDVWRIDGTFRGDRLATCEEALEVLERSSGSLGASVEILRALIDVVRTGDIQEDVFESAFNRMRANGASEGYVREQRNAYQALLQVLDTARTLGCNSQDALSEMMSTMLLPVSLRIGGEGEPVLPGIEPVVRIMSQERAAQLPVKSADTLIVCDLTADSYPLREPQSASYMLLERLGAGYRETALARARRTFADLLAVPSERLVVGRCINDAAADPMYPSAMLQELCAAYADDSDAEDLFGFPPALTEHLYEGGEEDTVRDVRPMFGSADSECRSIPLFSPGHTGAVSRLASPHRPGQVHPELPRLSASQIESFLECPYKWLVSNRMGADTLDEELGPRESGTFLHGVFQRFYMAFGHKVVPQNIDEARDVLFGPDGQSGIFAEAIAAQYLLDEKGNPPNGRYAVISGSPEEYEWERLRQQAARWLDFEASFLPRFTPLAFECRVKGAVYAGAEIDGVIDRIDIDDCGNAIVIDYKGTLKEQHRAKDAEGFRRDGKVQGLLYARLLQQAGVIAFDGEGSSFLPIGAYEKREAARLVPIERVVGAVYASYGSGNRVSGALDGRYAGKADVPTLTAAEHNVLGAEEGGSFGELLDFAEARARAAVAAIVEGHLDPDPSGKAACAYCPVASCGKRCV